MGRLEDVLGGSWEGLINWGSIFYSLHIRTCLHVSCDISIIQKWSKYERNIHTMSG